MKVFRSLALGMTLVPLLGAFALASAPHSMTISMKPEYLGMPGETGTATLTQTRDGVRFTIHLANAPQGVSQPTHIHAGTCDHLGAATYAIDDTMNGSNDSVLKGVTLHDLLRQPLTLRIHHSTKDMPHYVSCGNLSFTK